MKTIFDYLIMSLGLISLAAIVLASFICLCLLLKQARNHYLNAKDEVHTFVEFLQWKCNKNNEKLKAAKQQGGEL